MIYSIIGKRYSGKTTLSKVLHERTGMEIMDFNEFLKCKELSKKQDDNKYIISLLIKKLREKRIKRILIEDFPHNKEQYIYFVNNCKKLEKIYYLDADNSSCLERLNKLSLDDPNYVDSATLSELLYEFDKKKNFYDFLRRNAKFEIINVNNHLSLTIKQMMKQIQPYCVYVEVDEQNSDQKIELIEKFKKNYNFHEIEIYKIIENAKIRKLIDEKAEITMEEKIQLAKPLIFREGCSNIILNSFPFDIKESEMFESKLCKISKYLLLTEKNILII